MWGPGVGADWLPLWAAFPLWLRDKEASDEEMEANDEGPGGRDKGSGDRAAGDT